MLPKNLRIKPHFSGIVEELLATVEGKDWTYFYRLGYDRPLYSNKAVWLLAQPQIQGEYIEWCRKMAPQFPELQALFASGYKLEARFGFNMKNRTPRQYLEHCLYLTAVIPGAGKYPYGKTGELTIAFSPHYQDWDCNPIAEGVSDLEVGIRFMENPTGIPDVAKANWGRNLEEAVIDYCCSRQYGDNKLLLNKKGEIVRGTSGGRIIFASPEAAMKFFYPEGYDENEDEGIHHAIHYRQRELRQLMNSLPGESGW